jgi:amidase
VESPRQRELCFLSAQQIADRLESGETTSAEVVDALFARMERIEDLNGLTALRSMAAISRNARELAEQCDEQRRTSATRGALHGVPIVVKDNIEVSGLPGAAGSNALLDRPARDAAVITRLRDAGAIIIGSTNLSEWANIRDSHSTSGWSATGGLVRNPWKLAHSAGGSSSGSGAAVAARLAPLALGTETDGSIVCPAALNGVVGLKPTVGVVPTAGVVPISASQDSVGAMGRTVNDVSTLFGALSSQRSAPWRREAPRFAHATTWQTQHAPTDELVQQLVDVLRASSVEVLSRDVAVADEQIHSDELTVMLCELHDDLGRYLAQRNGDGVKSLADVIAYENTYADIELAHFGHDLFERSVLLGGRRSDEYADARTRNLEWALSKCLAPALDGVDVVLGAAYGPAWLSDLATGDVVHYSSGSSTAAAIAGLPIISVPLGVIDDLPVAVVLVARPHDEWTLLAAAGIVEKIVVTTLGRSFSLDI